MTPGGFKEVVCSTQMNQKTAFSSDQARFHRMRDHFDQSCLLNGAMLRRTGSLNIDVVAGQRGPDRQPDRSLVDEVFNIDSHAIDKSGIYAVNTSTLHTVFQHRDT